MDRGDLEEVLNTFDFASPDTPMGKRYETIVPQQALFLMNSPLVIEQVRNVVNRDAFQDCRFRRGANPVPLRAVLPASADRRGNPRRQGIRRDVSGGKRRDRPAPGCCRCARGGQRGSRAPGRTRRRARVAAAVLLSAVRLPLTGWQEYAHALLLTNEAAFVN